MDGCPGAQSRGGLVIVLAGVPSWAFGAGCAWPSAWREANAAAPVMPTPAKTLRRDQLPGVMASSLRFSCLSASLPLRHLARNPLERPNQKHIILTKDGGH